MHLCEGPFITVKCQISLPCHISQLLNSRNFLIINLKPEKKYLFWAESPHIGHQRDYLPQVKNFTCTKNYSIHIHVATIKEELFPFNCGDRWHFIFSNPRDHIMIIIATTGSFWNCCRVQTVTHYFVFLW